MSGTAWNSVASISSAVWPAADIDCSFCQHWRADASSSGAWRASAASTAAGVNANIPEFQTYRPDARYSCAVASCGFSTKRVAARTRSPTACAALDVAEAGVRVRRRDAEGRDLAAARDRDGGGDRGGEGRLVEDQMVGRPG